MAEFSRGARVPDGAESFTPHDTNDLSRKVVGLLMTVDTQGDVVLDYWDGSSITANFRAGTYIVPGNFRRVKSTGTTAVFNPATTVFGLYYKGQ